MPYYLFWPKVTRLVTEIENLTCPVSARYSEGMMMVLKEIFTMM